MGHGVKRGSLKRRPERDATPSVDDQDVLEHPEASEVSGPQARVPVPPEASCRRAYAGRDPVRVRPGALEFFCRMLGVEPEGSSRFKD